MSALRSRFVEDLKLAGYSKQTQDSYVRAVRQLAEHYRRSPDVLSEADVREYLLHCREVKHWARNTLTIAITAIKFFFERTLKRPWGLFDFVRPPRERKLPVILGRDQVWRLLSCVRVDTYRACLTTIYTCGLRLSEGVGIGVGDVDSDRMFLTVRGKGNKQRLVPLSQGLVDLLRRHWKTHRSPHWLFPSMRLGKVQNKPVGKASIQRAFYRALEQSGLRRKATVHSLRHSYGTHLLEDGVHLRLIQAYLGHKSPQTTMVYTHLTREVRATADDPVNRLMREI